MVDSKTVKAGIPYFGEWLKQRRKMLGMSRLDLAKQIPCSPDTIQKIETGARRPSREMALRLVESLNVPIRDHPALVEIARLSLSSVENLAWLDRFRPPSNLPVPPTPLIGRDKEVSTVCQMILCEPDCLLSIVGPPGVGKTRLALQVATSLRGELKDGVFMVPLASFTDPDLVLPTIARTLNLEDCSYRSIADQVITHLWDKELMLLVDNFEHVMSATSILVRLRAECPLLRLLVTSRTALRVRGERQFHLQPLSLPDSTDLPDLQVLLGYSAISLFVDRARAVLPDFNLTKQNALSIVSICRRLDGLPLAIELTATNLCILTPEMLLDSLNNGGLLESGELLDLEPRQRTLRDTLDWSYNSLTPLERGFLEQLAIFSGGWSLEAAMTVCVTPRTDDATKVEVLSSQVPDHLRSLVNKCLIVQHEENGSSRFTMLEVLREYLLEKFSAHESADLIRERHARYYLQFAESNVAQIHGINELQSLMQLDREISNFHQALEWCLSRPQGLAIGVQLSATLWWYWARRGFITEGRAWLMRFIDQSELADSPTSEIMFPLAKIYIGMGRLTWCQGDYISARSWMEKGLNFHRLVGDKWYLGYTFQSLADVFSDLDETSSAQEYTLESLRLARETGDPWLEGLPHALFGEIARNRGDYYEAQVQYTASLTLMRQAGDERNVAFMLHNLGQVAQRQGDYARAQELHVEALKIHLKSKPARAVAFGLEMLAGIAVAYGKPAKAVRLLGAADALRKTTGTPVEGTEMQFYTRIISQARQALDEQSYTSLWLDGYAMTLDQAVAYALEEEP